MVRTTKSEKPTTTTATADKKSKAKKEVAAPAPVSAPTETVTNEVVTDANVSGKLMADFGSKIQQLTSLLSTL